MIWLVERIKKPWNIRLNNWGGDKTLVESAMFSEDEQSWLLGRFTKVCLQVQSEEELLAVAEKAKLANLTVHVVTDAGLTEFDGIPTKPALPSVPTKPVKLMQ